MHRKSVTVYNLKKTNIYIAKSDHLQSKNRKLNWDRKHERSFHCFVCFGSIVLSDHFAVSYNEQENLANRFFGPLKPFTKQVENCTMNNQFTIQIKDKSITFIVGEEHINYIFSAHLFALNIGQIYIHTHSVNSNGFVRVLYRRKRIYIAKCLFNRNSTVLFFCSGIFLALRFYWELRCDRFEWWRYDVIIE